jgi:cell division protein FtsB
VSRRRRPSRRSIALRWLAVACFAAIAVAYVHPLRAYVSARGRVEQERTQVRKLEQERRSFDARVEVARSDGFVLREARRLNLVRPGERLFIVTGLGRRH